MCYFCSFVSVTVCYMGLTSLFCLPGDVSYFLVLLLVVTLAFMVCIMGFIMVFSMVFTGLYVFNRDLLLVLQYHLLFPASLIRAF